MNISLTDKIVSVLTYYTFGIFGVIWIIYANLARKNITKFLSFNLYQSIFISILLAAISLLYSIALNFLSVVPFVGKICVAFDLFFCQTPVYFGFTLSGLLITLVLTYLSLLAFFGRKSYLPLISDIVSANFGG